MSNTVVSVKPEYGVNYSKGYLGFTFTDGSFISAGIAWFTKWDRGTNPDVPRIPLSHVFIVSGENECIEATMPEVMRSPLTKYFDAPHTHVVFRKPVGLDDDIATRIVAVAEERIGCGYGYSLIVGHALANSLFGKLLGVITGGWSSRAMENLFDNRHQYICSELGSTALNEQPEYAGKGVLAHPPYTINPEALFNTKDVFDPWATRIKGVKVKLPVKRLKSPADAARS